MARLFCVAILTTFLVANTVANPTPEGWNELLNSQNVFHSEINSVQLKSNDKAAILGQLGDILAQDDIVSTLYSNYLIATSKNDPPKSELSFRKQLLKDSFVRVATHNIEARNGEHSYERGINLFSDMTEQEALTQYTMDPAEMAALKSELPQLSDPPTLPSGSTNYGQEPAEKDWTKTGKVTSVKNQGQCGSCTTFATTAQYETVYSYFKSKAVVDLSPQEILDCANNDGNDVCKTGMWPEPAYEMFKANGSRTEAEYPYQAKVGSCKPASKNNERKAANWYKAWDESEANIKKGVNGWGPIYVCINVNNKFMDYSGGVFDDTCDAQGLHSVTACGYGNEGGKDFWLIKNSWGPGWGSKGYIKIARGKNLCNIQQHPRIIMV